MQSYFQSGVTLNMTVSNRKSNDNSIFNAMGDFTEVMLVDFDFSMKKSLLEVAKETQKKISVRKKHGSVASSEIIKDYMALNGNGNGFPFPAVCTCMLFDLAGSKWEDSFKLVKRHRLFLTIRFLLKRDDFVFIGTF